MNMMKLFQLGDEIYGYCNGYFGRDDYDDKVCVMVTPKYAVFESITDTYGGEIGFATVLSYSDRLDEETVAEWKVKREEA